MGEGWGRVRGRRGCSLMRPRGFPFLGRGGVLGAEMRAGRMSVGGGVVAFGQRCALILFVLGFAL